MNRVLWAVQVLLALLFLFAGVMKLAMPAAVLAQFGASAALLRFVAVCEILGALALVLPGWLKVRRGLTPLAAAGLIVIMIGAVVISLRSGGAKMALLPAVTGALLAWVLAARLGWAVTDR